MGKDRLRPAQRERQQRVYDAIEREHNRNKALAVGKAEALLAEPVKPGDRQIHDSSACDHVSGPQFFTFRDVDGRMRCTTCLRLTRANDAA